MSQTIEIKNLCRQCNGTGTYSNIEQGGGGPSISCPWPGCNGTGYYTAQRIVIDPGLDDVMDKLQDVLDKCDDILEA